MAQSKSITAKLWDEIDTVVAQVVPLTPKIKAATAHANELDRTENDESPVLLGARLEVMTLTAEKNKLGGIGRGLAIALHLLCAPHFEDVGAVVKHAQARYKAAQAGETIETPGTGLARPKDEWPPDPEPNTDDGFEAAKAAPKGSSPAAPDPQAPATEPSSQSSPAFSSGSADPQGPRSGTDTQAVDAKKSARGAKKNTTAVPSSAAASGATNSTTEDSPVSPAKASAAPKATPAPTPDEIIAQDAARGPKPGVEAAVDKAAQVAAERRSAQEELEGTANEKIATLPNNGDEDDSPQSIAAMLADLEDM